MTDTSKVEDYTALSTPDLVKKINDEYSGILAGERNTFQKAVPIGQMLIELKPRVGQHGKWENWVKANLATKLARHLGMTLMPMRSPTPIKTPLSAALGENI